MKRLICRKVYDWIIIISNRGRRIFSAWRVRAAIYRRNLENFVKNISHFSSCSSAKRRGFWTQNLAWGEMFFAFLMSKIKQHCEVICQCCQTTSSNMMWKLISFNTIHFGFPSGNITMTCYTKSPHHHHRNSQDRKIKSKKLYFVIFTIFSRSKGVRLMKPKAMEYWISSRYEALIAIEKKWEAADAS